MQTTIILPPECDTQTLGSVQEYTTQNMSNQPCPEWHGSLRRRRAMIVLSLLTSLMPLPGNKIYEGRKLFQLIPFRMR